MNKLKVSATIECDTCGCKLHRQTSFSIDAATKEEAIFQVRERVDAWKAKLKGVNCKVCASIIRDVAA